MVIVKQQTAAVATVTRSVIREIEQDVLEGAEGWLGTTSLADSPERDGCIELGVVLLLDAMDTFASCFENALVATV